MIECNNIFLRFGDNILFKDLCFTLQTGEHQCITGASGRGKSTLLKLIQAYVHPDKGRIVIQGKELNTENVQFIRESITWIPQNVHLPVQNGMELLEMLHLKHKRPAIEDYADKLGLEPHTIDKSFAIISGGQKQRLIMAICFALEKNILLMDEPTASLDDDSIRLLLETLSHMKDRTILSASHNNLWINAIEKKIVL